MVDRTNNVLESYFHALKHGERRRSGRKNLTQDFEHLPPSAALATNLNHTDYVSILCGSLDRLPDAFAKLDAQSRQNSSSTTVISPSGTEAETASLSTADRRIVRTNEMTERVIAAAKRRFWKKKVA